MRTVARRRASASTLPSEKPVWDGCTMPGGMTSVMVSWFLSAVSAPVIQSVEEIVSASVLEDKVPGEARAQFWYPAKRQPAKWVCGDAMARSYKQSCTRTPCAPSEIRWSVELEKECVMGKVVVN